MRNIKNKMMRELDRSALASYLFCQIIYFYRIEWYFNIAKNIKISSANNYLLAVNQTGIDFS